MSSNDTPSFDDLTPVSVPNDDDNDDVPVVKLQPGEDLVAEVRHIERGVGKYKNNVLHLTRPDGQLCKMWSNGTIDRKLDAADVGPGDTIGIRKSTDSYEYETDDGDEREAYDFQVAVLGDN
ncbi:hypothetical protein SAMN04487949_1771 [Halogranum gelatinilyticum]|uniref:Uncharacterized protein n=1 Tax=Halogranum gelatinilyticum TaxID=660521 RepID=A0A1G9TGZ3_9EURY|nr:hypothetical protein [Halogranum gelatinilyticum]SDM47016.1 hypothetical protein SAMN04487949_1771 [Halogranum gelatinilyticum]